MLSSILNLKSATPVGFPAVHSPQMGVKGVQLCPLSVSVSFCKSFSAIKLRWDTESTNDRSVEALNFVETVSSSTCC